MKKLVKLGVAGVFACLSACAFDSDDRPTPTPEKTSTVIVPPTPTTPSEPSGPSISDHVPIRIDTVKPQPKLRLKNTAVLGKLYGAPSLAGNTSSFYVAWTHQDRSPASARAFTLGGAPLSATAFLPRSDAGVLSMVGLKDGGFLAQSFHWKDSGVYVAETQVTKDGSFVSSRELMAHQRYHVIKRDGGSAFGVIARDKTISLDEIPGGSKKTYMVSGDEWTPITEFAFSSKGVPAFGAFRWGDRIRVLVLIGQVDGSVVETTLTDYPISTFEKASSSSRSWVRGMIGTENGYFVLWQDGSKGEAVKQRLTFVKRDGSLGFSYAANHIAAIESLGDFIVAATIDDLEAETAGVSIFDQKMNGLDHLKLGPATPSPWQIKLAQGGDGSAFMVGWQNPSDGTLRVAVVEYK